MSSERLLRTMILALIGLAIFALLRPYSPDPQEDARSRTTWFFINKTHQAPVHDLVILGDSRGLRGISPQEMNNALPDRHIFNFSFNAGGMNPEMYDAAEALLDPAAADPVILLAPTPLAFMPHKRANSQYHEYRNKPRDLVWLYRHVPRVADWFQPVAPSVPFRRLLGARPTLLLTQVHHGDGWIETDQTPYDDLRDLTVHRDRLVSKVNDPTLMQTFMERTAEWTRRGIKVACILPPAYAPREALEDSALGFDRQEFRRSFERAGGLWLEVSRDGLESYDGSHLVAASARKMSRELGAALARSLSASR